MDQNVEDFIKKVTQIAIETNSEKLKIKVLTLLHGVGWPMASCLLHFGINENYPILDFRALWSLNVRAKSWNYNYSLWEEYCKYCQDIAKKVNVSVS